MIAANDSFDLLHEETFSQPEHGQYVLWMSFVNESGLHIPFVDYSDEDKLVFVNFSLEKN